MAKEYTFEDWLNNKFYKEKDYPGEYVANDSNRYCDLVMMGKMTYETVNKIQDAQTEAYEYGVTSTLKFDELQFQRKAKRSIDLKESLRLAIKAVEERINEGMDVYKVVIDGAGSRGLKIGASYILPEEYLKATKKEPVDFHIPIFSKYGLRISEEMTNFPTQEQMKFREMEVRIKWLKILKQKLEDLNTPKASAESLNQAKTIIPVNCDDLIEITMLPLILAAEKKAKPELSAIRCAAFCEILYEKGYIKKTNTKNKTMAAFASSRYNRDIRKALHTSKKDERKNYKNHPKAGQLPLKNCFL